MRDFREMRAWRAAHELTLEIYRISEAFPSRERYGLTAQIRRAASSIGANIAEGCGRHSDADANRCFQIAVGSAFEVLNHTILARDLGFLDGTVCSQIERDCGSVRKMLLRLVTTLRAPHRKAD